jgi:hypothetical protein
MLIHWCLENETGFTLTRVSATSSKFQRPAFWNACCSEEYQLRKEICVITGFSVLYKFVLVHQNFWSNKTKHIPVKSEAGPYKIVLILIYPARLAETIPVLYRVPFCISFRSQGGFCPKELLRKGNFPYKLINFDIMCYFYICVCWCVLRMKESWNPPLLTITWFPISISYGEGWGVLDWGDLAQNRGRLRARVNTVP